MADDDDGPDVTECGIPLTETGSLDLDLPAIRVSGRITLDGAPLPTSVYSLPQIELRGADRSTGTLVDLDLTPTGQYDVRVMPGVYDVLYSQSGISCADSPYPCQRGVVIRAAFAIRESGVLDLDLHTVHVTGRVTLDGAAPPAAGYSMPALELRGADRSSGTLVDLDESPTGTFDVRVIAGTYDVLYAESDSYCSGSPYPCQLHAPVRSAVALQTDGNLDVDIKTVTISGRVTLDGVALPTASPMPQLELRSGEETKGVLVDLEDHADGRYQVHVIPGSYEVVYNESTYSCTGMPFPCQRDAILRSVQLSTSGVLDVDIKTVGISGRITLDGAAPPSAYAPVIELRGVGKSSGVLVDVSRATSGTYQTRALAGQYDVLYTQTTCGTPWPCQQKRIIRLAAQLTSTGVLDLDIKTVPVTGRITLDGAPPTPTGDTLVVGLRGEDLSTGTLADLSVDTDGAYATRLLAGTYDLVYSNETCVGAALPCQQDAIVREAVTIAPGALDVDIATIGISGRITLASQPLPTASYALPRITLLGAAKASGTLVDLAEATAGTYQARVVPGRYVIEYDEASASCTGSPYPCQRARAIKGCGSD